MAFAIKKASGGGIQCRDFENKAIGIERQFVLDVEIDIEYQVGEKLEKGVIHLSSIKLPDIEKYVEKSSEGGATVNWSELVGKTYDFPVNPEPGYIDGTFYHLAHNPCDVTKITFSKGSGKQLDIVIDGVIDFTYEGVDGEVGTKQYALENFKATLKTESQVLINLLQDQ